MGLSAEESSSSYPDESGLELGLTLGGGCGGGMNKLGRGSLSSSSSSSSSHLTQAAVNNGASNQVVGWPPIRAYRMNSMANQVKFPSAEEIQSSTEKSKTKNDDMDMNLVEGQRKSNFVKASMDGNGIGRKVDLSAHNCYETLAQTMEDMFRGAATTRRSSAKEHDLMMGGTGSSKLLDGSSEFVLTYEDRDGDWMLVGDVPWGMFISSVKRLRIMRTSEANGLGSKFQVRNVRRCLPI